MSPRRSIRRQLSELQAACRACTRCVEDGIIDEAGPCFEGGPEAVFFLVGQAPGPTEVIHHRPFMGRAGRILSRTAARQQITEAELRRQMAGVWFDHRLSEKLRDEAPSAYKDIRAVLRAQHELVKVTRVLRPILNYKGG